MVKLANAIAALTISNKKYTVYIIVNETSSIFTFKVDYAPGSTIKA